MTDHRAAPADHVDETRRFDRMVEAAQIGITRVNGRGELFEANPAFLRMTGYSLEELRARGWHALTVPGYEAADAATLKSLVTHGVAPPYEKEYFRKDGSRLSVLLNGVRPDPAVDEHIVFVVDITARKQAEAAALEREARIALAMEASSSMWFEWDIVHDRVSRLFSSETTLPNTKESTDTFENVVRVVHPEDQPGFRARVTAALRSKDGKYASDYRLVRPDGTVRWMNEHGKVEFDAHAKPLRLIGVARDVTSMKDIESRLRASLERHNLLYAASPHPAWVFDLDTLAFLDVNPAAVALYGYDEAEFLQMKLLDIRLPEDVDHLLSHHRRVLAGESVGGQFRHRKKSGEFVWVETRVQVLTDGFQGRRAALVQLIDITESKRAQEALRARTAELESLLMNAPLGLAFFDREHRFVRVNEELAHMNGIAVAQHLGRTVGELLPHNARIVGPLVDKVFATGRTLRNVEIDGETPAEPGVTRHWLAGFYPVYDDSAKVEVVGVWVTEVTEQRRARVALQQYAEELKAAATRKDHFLATLAHELRNPMAPMRNAVAVIERLPEVDPTVAKMTQMIERQVKHLARLVDDLLDISRVTQGKITLRKDQVELYGALQAGIELARPLLDAKHHQLSLVVPSAPLHIEGDATRIAQIIGNLLNNAAKYTEEHGQIMLKAERDAQMAVIRVRDNGVGIGAELLPYVFDIFTQADRSLDRSQGGLGIGLSLVKNLVELHGGEVSATSDGVGQGSEFVVRLPMSVQRTLDYGETSSPDASHPLRRILVVDDNHDAADSLAALLSMSGHSVQCAYDGPSAVSGALAFEPEVIVLDLGLPGIHGYDVAKRLLAEPSTQHALLIALSGYGQPEDKERSASTGFDHHLVKPVDADELTALIRAGKRNA